MMSRRLYGFIAGIAVVLFFLCCSGGPAYRDILGVWKTQDKDSSGVSIEFTEKSLIISSDLGVMENKIVKVKSEKGSAADTTIYSIYYADRGGKTNLMEVIYSPEGGGTLRFKSEQNMLWKRAKSASLRIKDSGTTS